MAARGSRMCQTPHQSATGNDNLTGDLQRHNFPLQNICKTTRARVSPVSQQVPCRSDISRLLSVLFRSSNHRKVFRLRAWEGFRQVVEVGRHGLEAASMPSELTGTRTLAHVTQMVAATREKYADEARLSTMVADVALGGWNLCDSTNAPNGRHGGKSRPFAPYRSGTRRSEQLLLQAAAFPSVQPSCSSGGPGSTYCLPSKASSMQTGGLLFCPSLESFYKARDQPRSVQGTALTGQKTRVSDPMVRIQRHPQTGSKPLQTAG